TFDVDSLDLATGQRARVRSDMSSSYGYYGAYPNALVSGDGRWLVSQTNTAGLSITDLTTQQEPTILDGVFSAPGASLVAVDVERAIVASPSFLLAVELADLAPTWFNIADLGFAPGSAAIDGAQIALVGVPLFDPAIDPAGGFVARANLYILDLATRHPRL